MNHILFTENQIVYQYTYPSHGHALNAIYTYLMNKVDVERTKSTKKIDTTEEKMKKILFIAASLEVAFAVLGFGIEVLLYALDLNLCHQIIVPLLCIAYSGMIIVGAYVDKRWLYIAYGYGISLIVLNCFLLIIYTTQITLFHQTFTDPQNWFTKRKTPDILKLVNPVLGMAIMTSVAQIVLMSVQVHFGRAFHGHR
ncbi:uncharacterized protein LOC141902863 [Tubulanus polymorphus]|uniref:uncharacterized protein LOC141902863 n=1 Tax=Tubulanus polymorphus TaxID=672921 RepID=UPI003DA3CB4A